MKLFTILAALLIATFIALPLFNKDAQAQGDNMNSQKLSEAIFAGGCFWCMESDFEHIDGVTSAISGYIGGHVADPEYRQVSGGSTGHYEAIKVIYDPQKISYQALLGHFWKNIDPFNADGQFCDYGDQYRAAVFYADEKEKDLAKKSKTDVQKQFKEEIVTEIIPTSTFYDAEEYHQDYYLKSAPKYKFYRWRCGRDKRLNQIWGEGRNEKPPFKYYKDD